ncbi:hypothetical protein [Streptomyces sp. NPDC091217]|uniref:hypothetical protein n=1 Tax=Streptomyces sp. NPDC091217 TaxID=3365975 RepID=UPI00380E2CA0
MTDGIAWLAAPRSIAFGGYSVVLARGLDADMPRRDVHRTALEVIERYFGLSLPRSQVLEAALPAVILE